MTRVSARRLTWNGNELCRGVHPSMWRIRRPAGTLSDQANRARAKDAALSVAPRLLEVSETALEGGRSGDSQRGGAVAA
jgi:hypothetical protein